MLRKRRTKEERYLNPKSKYRMKSPSLYYRYKLVEFTLSRLRKLKAGVEIRRHTTLSRDSYNTYDDWEMRIYEAGQTYTLNDGAMGMVSFRDIRDAYIAPVISEIEAAVTRAGQRRINVLEVGCGNGTNLMLLKQHFGETVNLAGFDIASERIARGKAYWGPRLEGIDLGVDSALELSAFDDKSVDILFSVHCLEQLPYHVPAAISAMVRVARERIVFVEPVYEFGNSAQKLYSILGDQLRTLMPEIGAAGLTVLDAYPTKVLANPMNRTGVVIVDPGNPEPLSSRPAAPPLSPRG